jgi:hypothetical protein
MPTTTRKDVFTIIPRTDGAIGPDGKKKSGHFVRIGAGFVNHDGSMNLRLDALPVNGTIHIRDHLSEEERQRRFPRRESTPPQPVGLG